MKTVGTIMLLMIAMSLTSPVNPALQGHSGNDNAAIFTLNLCDDPGQPLSAHSDAPSLLERSEDIIHPSFAGFNEVETPAGNTFLIVFSEEHPPKP